MTGTTTSKWTFAFALCLALAAMPLAATPIGFGSTSEIFNGVADFQVVTNHGGEVSADLTTFLNPGAVAGNPSTVVITSTPYYLPLSNNGLALGSTISAATLILSIDTLLTPGASSLYTCEGTGCGNYTLPLIQSDTYSTVLTVVSTSGTTYTWNYQMNSGSASLNLLTANPDFADDLAGGDNLTIAWTQTVTLSGEYTPPSGGASSKCRDCTLVFRTPLSGRTNVSGTVDATFTEPPDPPNPVPEPSTGLLLGLGIMAMAATLRRRISPR